MGDLTIRVSQMSGNVPVSVLHISGDVDASTHVELDAEATAAIDQGATHILLDLTDCNYMSSAGFRSIHKIHSAIQVGHEGGSRIKLLKPTDEVKRLLKTMGFNAYVTVHDDLNEAIKAF
jgi:anti-sigma B factor antagonist